MGAMSGLREETWRYRHKRNGCFVSLVQILQTGNRDKNRGGCKVNGMQKIYEGEIIKSLTAEDVFRKARKDFDKRLEQTVKKHMNKIEKFVFDNTRNWKIKKFILKKYRIESTTNGLIETINIYKKNALIDTITIPGKIVKIR